MTTWQWLSLMGVLLVQTAALFRWMGKTDREVKEHDVEIRKLRDARHDTANLLTAHSLEIENLKEDVAELKEKLP